MSDSARNGGALRSHAPGRLRAILYQADLTKAVLASASMTEALLVGTDLTGADIDAADLSGARDMTPDQLQQTKDTPSAPPALGAGIR